MVSGIVYIYIYTHSVRMREYHEKIGFYLRRLFQQLPDNRHFSRLKTINNQQNYNLYIFISCGNHTLSLYPQILNLHILLHYSVLGVILETQTTK